MYNNHCFTNLVLESNSEKKFENRPSFHEVRDNIMAPFLTQLGSAS